MTIEEYFRFRWIETLISLGIAVAIIIVIVLISLVVIIIRKFNERNDHGE